MNLHAGGLWNSIKGEVMTDLDALWFFPGEVVRTISSGTDALGDVMTAVRDEIETDINALVFFPEEIGKSAEQIITPPASAVQAPLDSIKWIVIAGLGIYALTLVAPTVKRTLK